ncbi:hypothetical protein KSZ_71900 [Dictyobacter formicarum]|uniref:Uncharacterized protein n=1 Tax=Dictyobacter formicarum TaxID=2778368 RepID=A0ABQ3VU75_9CHLR|nr:hypothetical protein KSZ_71900 [Dictyobacter formicarum]
MLSVKEDVAEVFKDEIAINPESAKITKKLVLLYSHVKEQVCILVGCYILCYPLPDFIA